MPISVNRAGWVVGALFASWHFMWALLVAIGWAQPVIDFLFWIHFIKPAYQVVKFDAGIAAALMVFTAGVGYAIGCMFALLWNRLHR